jgi:hypothetical protein
MPFCLTGQAAMALLPTIFPLPEDSTDKFDSTSKFRHPVLPKQGELSSGQILVFGDF